MKGEWVPVGGVKIFYGPQLSEYVQVVCRNMNATCLKWVSKTPTQVFQGFPALKETVAHIQPNSQFWIVFGQNWQNEIFFKKAFRTFFRC